MATLDTIQLRDLKVDCIIGVNASERLNPQKLFVQVELGVNTEKAACSELLEETVDYELVASQIVFLLNLCQFHLLETACHVLCRTLLLPPVDGERRAPIESVGLSIEKPEGLLGRAAPLLQVNRQRSAITYPIRARTFGIVHVVHETPQFGIYRLSLAPGSNVPLHMHRRLQEAEMLLSEGVWVQDAPGPRGSIRLWPQYFPHSYYNPTEKTQSILCVCRPTYCQSDEILVNGKAAPIAVITPRDLETRQLGQRWPQIG